jgi:fructokinase
MRVGVDLGGTKIEIVAFDGRGAELLRRRVPSPARSYADIVETIATMVESAEREAGETASVGVGAPGATSRSTGLIKNANSTVLIGRPLAHDLAQRLGREVRLANDADCFALSEATDGAGRGARTVFGVILGTGVGGGVVVEGRLLRGPNAIAGEWGHNSLPWPRADELPGPPCYCGKRGCIETFLSGPGFSDAFAQRTGRRLTGREIASAAAAGDCAAAQCLEAYADRLARALAHVINILDPEVVVLGGGLSNVAGLYEATPPRLKGYVFSDSVETRLVRAKHGDSSGVRGAAWLWKEQPA